MKIELIHWAIVAVELLYHTVHGTNKEKIIDLLDEECGIYNAIIHKQHTSSANNVDSLKLQGSKQHAHADRIFGQRNWPWMAILRNNTHFLCNGILIRKDFILTTASCLEDKKPSSIVAELKGKVFKLKDFKKHEGSDIDRPNKLAGDIAVIQLSESTPAEKLNSGIMSICMPRTIQQTLHAQECAVSYLWETDRERNRIEMDTAARLEENDSCEGKDSNIDGVKGALTCISTRQREKPVGSKKGQVVYFLTCKTSGYWTVFGLTKFDSMAREKTTKRQYAYYLTLPPYMSWVKDIVYKRTSSKRTIKGNNKS